MDINRKESGPELDERYNRFKQLTDSWKSVMSIEIDMDKTKAKGSKIKKHLSGPELSINQFDHYIKLIDSNLARCEVLGVSRLNTEWGIYSAQMNRETKKYSGELVAILFQYWLLSSQLLEAKYKNVGVSKARKVLQELKKEIPKYIIN